MELKDKIDILKSIIKVKVFKNRIPLAVRWQVTNKCVCKCSYCNIWNKPSLELNTKQIFYILDELHTLGTKRISFSGGEPLLRDDIGQIINYCKQKGIYPEMNSTGELVKSRINDIKDLSLLKLSLDGPQEIHDSLSRRKGSFEKVMEAAKIAKNRGIKVIFTTTLTKDNIEHLDFLLKIAEKFNALIAFQPLKHLSYGVEDLGNLYPDKTKYKKAIKMLIDLKEKRYKYLRNSLIGLKHIYNWPNYKRLECWAGRIFCIIETNGDLYPCDRIRYSTKLPNCSEIGFKKAFNMLPSVACTGCGFCGSLELNFLLSFKLSIINVLKKLE